MAHGAGAGTMHPFLQAFAAGLFERSLATLRYNFPFMDQGSRRPSIPAVAHATVRAAVDEARRLLPPSLPLFAGGKSFGGRMTSQAQADRLLPGVRGLIFVGFPLHSVNKPSDTRAQHLSGIDVPMLFLQGSRDALAERSLLIPVIERLGSNATLVTIEDGDHSFHVPARSGGNDAQALATALDAVTTWTATVARN